MKNLLILLCTILISAANIAAQTTDPTLYFGSLGKPAHDNGKAAYTTTCSDILANPTLHIENATGWEVTSYTVSIAPRSGAYLGPYNQHKPQLSPDLQEIIKKQKGKKGVILIENIKVKGSDNRTRSFNNLTLFYNS